jgi:hypothetical protein
LALDNDAYAVAKAKGDHENVSWGEAASRLILQTVKLPPQKRKNGAVFRSPGGHCTSAQVEEAVADE